jgi:CheY-like chemotaxis protein
MNLVTNARDAMPKGGAIEIRTEPATLDDEFVAAHGGGHAGKYATVIVSDSGEGIDAGIIKRVFDPFFTTKEQGKGTGLGLSMVHGIIGQHNGLIDVSSQQGNGTTFRIYLPLYKAAKQEVQEQIESEGPLRGGSETILVGEDDPVVRELYTAVLASHGYQVIAATDGDDAINKYIANRDDVRLVVLDGIMPKKSGKQTYQEIKSIEATVRVLFVTGYTEDNISDETLLEPGIGYLRKPFAPAVLLKKIRDLLDGCETHLVL